MIAASRIATALALVAATTFTLAAESRIPIAGPITIASPGTYVVTQDFDSGPLNAIAINTGGSVTIDLNGHTVSSSNAGTIIAMNAALTTLTLRNGHLNNAASAIVATTAGARLRIDDVFIDLMSGTAISASSCREAVITRTTIDVSSAGIALTLDPAAPAMLRIAGNEIRTTNRGINLSGGGGIRGGEIVDNVVAAAQAEGIVISETVGGLSIRNNTVTSGSGSALYLGGAGGHSVEGNVVRFSTGIGIEVASNVNRVFGNTTTGGFNDGIRVSGQWNVIESNQCGKNAGYGLEITGSGNLVRNNTCRGNATGDYNLVAGTSDGGGNF